MTAKNITIIADSNISHLDDYFNSQILSTSVSIKLNLITMAGRDITAEMIEKYQPHALLVRSVTHVNSELLQNNNTVKYVGSATIGTDHIDQDYLASRDIAFANASGCSKHSVAQYVMTAILHQRPELAQSNAQPITLGIIGLGNIGSTLAKYAKAMGWNVLGYDPLLDSSLVDMDVDIQHVNVDTLLSQADIVSLHVPLSFVTPHKNSSEYPTYHLIDETALAMMKPTAMLINSARGQVIQESALLADIERTGRTVVLDVFEHEPVVSSELIGKLALATPHIAGYSLEGKLRGTHMVYETFCQQFGLSITQNIDDLLPHNPYHWQTLQADFTQLTDFYPINQDDNQLRQAVDKTTNIVSAKAFDTLRKEYQLRREWVF